MRESGNEPYIAGKIVIGNPPGNQARTEQTEDEPPAQTARPLKRDPSKPGPDERISAATTAARARG